MKTLLTINDLSIDINEAIRRDILHDSDFLNSMIEELIIRSYAASKGIENTTEELQVAIDEKRYEKGLESVENTKQWLADNQQTALSVQNGLDYQLLRNKVRNSFTDDELRAYYNDHKLEYEKVDFFSIRCDTEAMAQEIISQIDEEGEPFSILATEHSLDEISAIRGGYVGRKKRKDVTAEIEAALFNSKAGQVIGPMKTDKGWNIFKVARITRPEFEKLKGNIQFALVNETIARLKAEAKISYPIFEQEND
jgi:parvulin-like peptidyl-prolyl isomerase